MTTEQEERAVKAQEDLATNMAAMAQAFLDMQTVEPIELSALEIEVNALELQQRKQQAEMTIARQDEEIADLVVHAKERQMHETELFQRERHMIINGLLDINGNPLSRTEIIGDISDAIVIAEEERILSDLKKQLSNLKKREELIKAGLLAPEPK